MPKKKLINPPSPRAGKAPFSQGVQVGETLYVSGQIAQDADGQIVGVGDMDAQARQVFANIEAVLAEAGATLEDVVKITTYITDMSAYAAFSEVRAEMFPNAGMASATVAGAVLVSDDFMVEVEAIAVKGSGD